LAYYGSGVRIRVKRFIADVDSDEYPGITERLGEIIWIGRFMIGLVILVAIVIIVLIVYSLVKGRDCRSRHPGWDFVSKKLAEMKRVGIRKGTVMK